MRFLVLGAGQQGRAVATNLAERADTEKVLLADVVPPRDDALPRNVHGVQVDATDADAVRGVAEGADAAVTLLPAAIGTVALPELVDAGVPVVDVSFTPELPFHLDARAREAGVPVVVDMGIAPGLGHVISGVLHRDLGGLDTLRILVGGMPVTPRAPWHHAVYFNARDLLDEYLRPANVREGGKDRALVPLDVPVETFEDPDLGTFEGFPSDGLRSLLDSYPDVPDMVELTLRVPGHLAVMRTLRDLGFFEPGSVDATAATLARRYPGRAHPDFLLMEVHGARGDARDAYRVHVEHGGGLTAMSRATASTAAATARLLAAGTFAEPGVHAPEKLADVPGAAEALFEDVRARGVPVERKSALAPHA